MSEQNGGNCNENVGRITKHERIVENEEEAIVLVWSRGKNETNQKTERKAKKKLDGTNSRNGYEKRKDSQGNESTGARQEVEEMGTIPRPVLRRPKGQIRNRGEVTTCTSVSV